MVGHTEIMHLTSSEVAATAAFLQCPLESALDSSPSCKVEETDNLPINRLGCQVSGLDLTFPVSKLLLLGVTQRSKISMIRIEGFQLLL